jgi:DNA polymerase III subunit alpha, Gram-positive type
MLLREDLRYVVLDFETTGTDKKYDEIIQIGLSEFGVDGSVIQQFCSYIKPQHTDKLHDIIGMITGISQEDVLHAPSREDILPTVKRYFDAKTVIIGHSV